MTVLVVTGRGLMGLMIYSVFRCYDMMRTNEIVGVPYPVLMGKNEILLFVAWIK